MRSPLSSGALVSIALLVVGCTEFLPTPPPIIPATTCAEYLAMADGQRADLVTAIVDAEGLLELVRERQHERPTTSRGTLILEAVESVRKNCEVLREPGRRVVQLTMELYANGRSFDGRP